MGLRRAEDAIAEELERFMSGQQEGGVEEFAKLLQKRFAGTYVTDGDAERLDERAPTERRERAKREAARSGKNGNPKDGAIRR